LALKVTASRPEIVDDLEELLRQHVLIRFGDPSGELSAMRLDEILIVYGTWRTRQLFPMPRSTHISRELSASTELGAHQTAFDAIAADIAAGNDLGRYLSRASETAYEPVTSRAVRLPRRQDRDLLLADWGIHHLHLSTTLDPDGFVSRTEDLLFAVFVRKGAYLIGIYPHGSWGLTELLEIFVRNWGEGGLLLRSRTAIGLTQHYTDEERLRLRNAGVMSLIEIDGAVYMPPGQTAAGTPSSVTHQVNQSRYALSQARDSISADSDHLDSYLEPSARAESQGDSWRPYLDDESFGFIKGNYAVVFGQLPGVTR
jgi:hypothetical protein